LKVLTFNIWNYAPHWPRRRAMIANTITTMSPDVVALQETRHDFRFHRGEGQGRQLAGLTGYHATTALGQVYVPLLRIDEGLTILTREPPITVFSHTLTRLKRERGDENQRILLGVRVAAAGAEIDVYCTHFSLSQAARVANAREVVGFTEADSGDRPCVVMGDLNAEPGSTEIRYLTEEQGFLDCWPAVYPDAPGFTYASWDPVRRIDYVLARAISSVRSIERVGDQPEEGVYPSDHLGLIAELDL
jgi:endonuclease/exonuclease/phosphatase family metal-dependent hydrolase